MVRQAEAILESDPPSCRSPYEKIYDAWHNRVRGQNPGTFFGIYDVVRWDTVSVAGYDPRGLANRHWPCEVRRWALV